MIENKRIDNPRVTIVSVSAKAQDEKKRWNTTKTNKERNFQYTHLLHWFLSGFKQIVP